MMLPIPRVIDDYNQCMNAVDHADQLLSSMTTHLISHRVWLPLFYWLLDCAKVNAWCLYNIHYKEENDHINSAEEASKRFTHREFQQELAYSLILDGYRKMKGHVSRNDPMPDKRVAQKKGIKINEFRLRESKTVLSHRRFDFRRNHDMERGCKRRYCVWCIHLANMIKRPVLGEIVNGKIIVKRQRGSRTQFRCSECDVYLCKEPCFAEFHGRYEGAPEPEY